MNINTPELISFSFQRINRSDGLGSSFLPNSIVYDLYEKNHRFHSLYFIDGFKVALFKLTRSKCRKMHEKIVLCVYKANKHGLSVGIL